MDGGVIRPGETTEAARLSSADWVQRGIGLRQANRQSLAIGCYRRALDADPDYVPAWSNLGNALKDLHRTDAAIAAHRRAAALLPDNPLILLNLAIALRQGAAWHEARAVLTSANALAPANSGIAWERALINLQLGAYAQGFKDYEARFDMPNGPQIPPEIPKWRGEPLAGRRILLLPEQGYGDGFLALRYVAHLRERGATVVLASRPATQRLLQAIDGIEIVGPDGPATAVDFVCPLMSLPGLFATTLSTIPAPWRPAPDPGARDKAKNLVPRRANSTNIGIVWAGSDGFADNMHRSIPLPILLSLLEVPNVQLFSLQKGPHETSLPAAAFADLVIPLGPQLDDFAETAAVLQRLDLVVMTDSAVAHLAGSAGRPVWALLHRTPYWIFGTDGPTTPWYPSMRLFRQPANGGWHATMTNVIDALSAPDAARADQPGSAEP